MGVENPDLGSVNPTEAPASEQQQGTIDLDAEAAAAMQAGDSAFQGDDAVDNYARNEAIMQYQNQIRAEEASRMQLVGNLAELNSLKAEYANGNDIFVRKIESLEKDYSGIRRTRGDGNCFFRAFCFGLLEYCLDNQDEAECARLTSCLQTWKGKLVEQGYQELVFEDALDALLSHMDTIRQGLMSKEALEDAYREEQLGNMVVMLLRFITSAEVKRREDFFLPFIMGMYDDPPPSVEAFCQRYVDAMYEESDNLHIVALTDALQVPVRVVYLDRSGADALFGGGPAADSVEVNIHDFIPEACTAAGVTAPKVHVLYRPGHYDMLYMKRNT